MSSASLTHVTGSERIALWTSSSCSYLDQDPREASSLARLFQPYEWCHAIRQRRGQAPDACRPVLQISAEPLRPMPFDWLSLSPQSAVSVSAPVPTGRTLHAERERNLAEKARRRTGGDDRKSTEYKESVSKKSCEPINHRENRTDYKVAKENRHF